MKKRVFTLSLLAGLALGAYAQDTSGWKEGQDVTNLLNWKATTGDQEDMDNPAWKGFDYQAGTSGSDTRWEFANSDYERPAVTWGTYNIPQWDVYQEFTIPAGLYNLTVQALYREGDANVSFRNWDAGTPTQNAYLYVQVGDERYETKIMSLWGSKSTESYYQHDGWQNDQKQTSKDGNTYYAPSCHDGATAFFENGKFGENEVLFAVPEEMTIRIGISKQVEQAQDQVWWNNFRITWEGDYDDDAKKVVALTKFNTAVDAAENLADVIGDSYPSLAALLEELVGEIDVDPNNSTLDEVYAALDLVNSYIEDFQVARVKVQNMDYLVTVCEGLLQVTDYPEKAQLEAAIATAKSALGDGEGEQTIFSVQGYLDAANALAQARVNYVLSQDKNADGFIDVTNVISCPWFVNQEYTPTFRDGEYKFPQEIEDTWGAHHPNDECNVEIAQQWNDDENQWLVPLADKVDYTTSKEAENRWIFQNNFNGWIGGMQNNVQWLKGYCGIYTGWCAGPNTGDIWVKQVVTNLPDGFYTIEGRMFAFANEGNEADLNQYVFLQCGDKMVQANNTTSKGYWSYYGRGDWTDVTTDFLQVTGGTVTLGYHHNSMALNTGVTFRYYGESPDYSKLVNDRIAELNNKYAGSLTWAGDRKAVDDILATISMPITSPEAYSQAIEIVKEADKYASEAARITTAFDLPGKYATMQENYSNKSEEYAIIEPALQFSLNLGNGENDTYKDAEEANKVYAAYESYMRTVDKARSYNTDEANTTIATQAADLATHYATIEELDRYESALSAVINKAIFAELNADKATLDNPVEVTSLLVNPALAEGPTVGWTSEGATPTVNTYGRQNAEIWNASPFDIHQTIKNLPEGLYEFRARACYRDAGDVGNATSGPYYNWWVAANADIDNWENHNAIIYASSGGTENSNYVKSVCDGKWTTPSFDKWWNAKDSEEAVNAGYVTDWDGTICILEGEETVLNEDDLIDCLQNINLESPAYPFDTRVQDGDNVYYYPSSMAGFYNRLLQSPEAYNNSVRIYVKAGGNATIGLRKTAAIGNDWLIYDDFQLFYLGNDETVGIANLSGNAGQQTIYNIQGQRLNAPQKGMNIINGKKVFIK